MKMKKQLDIKKLLLLNMPYILMGLFATNFGEGWRMAVGADASAKMLSFFSTLPVALASWWPSLHPLDLLVGLCCGAGLRLAVYLKSKNAKKYRHGMEYGSARWGCPSRALPPASPRVFRGSSLTDNGAGVITPISPPATPSSLTGTWMAAPTMWALWSAQTAAGSTPWRAILATPARSRVIPCPTSASRATA